MLVLCTIFRWDFRVTSHKKGARFRIQNWTAKLTRNDTQKPLEWNILKWSKQEDWPTLVITHENIFPVFCHSKYLRLIFWETSMSTSIASNLPFAGLHPHFSIYFLLYPCTWIHNLKLFRWPQIAISCTPHPFLRLTI